MRPDRSRSFRNGSKSTASNNDWRRRDEELPENSNSAPPLRGGYSGPRGGRGRGRGGNGPRQPQQKYQDSSQSASHQNSRSSNSLPRERETSERLRPEFAEMHRISSVTVFPDKLKVVPIEGHVYKAIIYSVKNGYANTNFGNIDKEVFTRFSSTASIKMDELPVYFQDKIQSSVVDWDSFSKSKQASDYPFFDIKVISVTENTVRGKVKLSVHAMVCPPRNFLILDLNGVLLMRNYDDRSKYAIRPYTKEFLDMCFQKYHVGVWTCGNDLNIEEMKIFGENKKNLVFEFEQSMSTDLRPRTSIVSIDKPLFIKELEKVFRKYPSLYIGPFNTLMIDNHIEKFERNTLGTCCLVPSFGEDKSLIKSDTLFHPNSKFVVYINELSRYNDIVTEVRRLSDEAEIYFPKKYPAPPDSLNWTKLKKELVELYKDCTSTQKLHAMNFQDLEKPDSQIPCPKANILSGIQLKNLAKQEHVVCEKTDGERYLLFISAKCQTAYFVSRFYAFRRIGESIDQEKGIMTYDEEFNRNVVKFFSPSGKATILDGEELQIQSTKLDVITGEIVENNSTLNESNNKKTTFFLIFDAILLDGQNVSTFPSLYSRLYSLRTIKDDVNQGKYSVTHKHHEIYHQDVWQENERDVFLFGGNIASDKSINSRESLSFLIKYMNKINETHKLDQRIIKPDKVGTADEIKETSHYLYQGECRTSVTDGLVFTPTFTDYFSYFVWKYKPLNCLTIDFLIEKKGLQRGIYLGQLEEEIEFEAVYTSGSTTSSYENRENLIKTDLYLKNMVMDAIYLTVEEAESLLKFMTIGNHEKLTIECRLEKGLWKLLRTREDKIGKSNGTVQAWDNLKACCENLSLAEVINYASTRGMTVKPEKILEEILNREELEVAKHYDERQDERNKNTEMEKRVEMVRRMGNWVKAIFIYLATENKLDALPSFDEERNRQFENWPEMEPVLESIKNFNRTGNALPLTAAKERRLKVLDLACGRGADILKWSGRENIELDTWIGVDISKEEIIEVNNRLTDEENSDNFSENSIFKGIVGSMTDPKLTSRIKNLLQSDPTFDFISIQLAFHYTFGHEHSLRKSLINIKEMLEPTGKVLITCIDPRALTRANKPDSIPGFNDNLHLEEKSSAFYHVSDYGFQSFGNEIYKVNFLQSEITYDKLGESYNFSLKSALEECKEYVVPLNILEEEALKVGLHVEKLQNYGEFIHSQLNEYAHLLPQFRVNTMTLEQWEVLTLYCVLILTHKD